MSDYDPLSFFDEAPSSAAPTTEVVPVVETPAAAPVAAPEAVQAPAAVEPKPEFEGAPAGFVPVSALQAERTKRQSLEEQVAAAKTPVAPAAPVAQAPVPQAGTPEHAAYLQDQIMQQQIDNKFNLSESRFTVQHGVEETQKLQAWVEGQDVFFFQRLLSEADPYAAAKVLYDQAEAATAYKAIPQTELEAFRTWQATQAAAVAAGQPVTPTVTPPVVVAPSVAAAAKKEDLQKPVSSGTILTTPSAAGTKPGETPAAPGAAFSNTFN